MNLFEIAAGIAITTSVMLWIFVIAVPTYVLPYMRRTPKVEGNVKLTFDEMGITLEEASDKHYDAEPLKKIKSIHRREHENWQHKFDALLPAEVEIWDEDADETLLIEQCKNHSRNEVCIYCDPLGMQPVPRKKRHRRKR